MVSKYIATLVIWAILRKFAPKYAPLSIFVQFAIDHIFFSLASFGLADWYIEGTALQYYEDRLYFNLFFVMLFNYNSFVVTLVNLPWMFFTPYVFYCIWASKNLTETESKQEFSLELLVEKLITFALILFICLTHNYLVQKDLAKATIENIMISRQQTYLQQFIEESANPVALFNRKK